MPRRKIKKATVKNEDFGQFKLPESYTSLVLGAIIVLIVGISFVFFAKGNRNAQTSSTNNGPKIEEQKSQEESETATSDQSKISSTYTIKPGDDLWSISENIYKDGYKWIEIAKVNKLEDPGLIHVGNKLTIPMVEKKIVMQPNNLSQETNKITEGNAINNTTYTIKKGDNLWDISVRAYGDGFKWPKLAKINNIENPDLIYADNVLKIPR